MDLNTCYETTKAYHSVATYSHLVPLVITAFLTLYILFKSKFSFLSKTFATFSFFFCLWLIGDLITWLSKDYNLVVFVWGQLDNINIIFFSLAAYFFVTTIKEKDVNIWHKLFLGLITLPGFYITYTLGTVASFDQAYCDVNNSDFLTTYKLIQEFLCVLYILIIGAIEWFHNKGNSIKRSQIVTIGIAFVLFLSIFGITEYISSVSGGVAYIASLYGLFVLPLFLALIVFTIVRLELFQVRSIATQLLVYLMIIMVATQFLFLENTTNRVLNGITLILSIFFGIFLLRNINNDKKYREIITGTNKQLENLLHFISHEVKGALNKSRIALNEIIDDSDGKLGPELTQIIKMADSDTKRSIDMVMNILGSADFKSGKIAMTKAPFDFKASVLEMVADLSVDAKAKGIVITTEIPDGVDFTINGDREQLTKHVIRNLIDNSVKYTPTGSVAVGLTKNDNKVVLSIKDTGVGITDEDKKRLFTEGGKGIHSSDVNVHSTGYGLYFSKGIIEAHGGRVWAESAGQGKGSQFYAELPVS